MRAVFLLILTGLFGCVLGSGKDDVDNRVYPFKAAAGKVKITPERSLPMAGFFKRKGPSIGVHDDIYARCVVVEDAEGDRLAIISVDLIGFLRYDVLPIQKHFDFPVIVFATHTHSGPDTLGIWGRDEAYVKSVREKIIALIKETQKRLEPARFVYNQVEEKKLSVNYREDIKDTTLTTVRFLGKNGCIATIVNFGCHPEALREDNRLISPDFPAYIVSPAGGESEKDSGVWLFVNGSLGGMVSVVMHGFAGARRIGSSLRRKSIASLRNAKDGGRGLEVRKREVSIPISNPLLLGVLKNGRVPSNKKTFRDGKFFTEVYVIKLGELTILTFPGEVLPRLGLKARNLVNGPSAVWSMANDEIGYILPESYWRRKDDLFAHEKGLSLGPKAGPILFDALRDLTAY